MSRRQPRFKIRRGMTLIEVLVALGLTSFLLMILMMFYSEMTKLNHLNDIASKESFQDRYIDNRLSEVFSMLIPETDTKRPFYFMTTDELSARGVSKGVALIFGYDNGVIRDKKFAGDVVGTLFVDKHDRLMLMTIPPPSHWDVEKDIPLHKEVLMENVDQIKFKFYEPEESDVEKLKLPPMREFDKWEVIEDKDKKSDEHVPVFVWMLITKTDNRSGKKNDGRGYIFVLPRQKHPILYVK